VTHILLSACESGIDSDSASICGHGLLLYCLSRSDSPPFLGAIGSPSRDCRPVSPWRGADGKEIRGDGLAQGQQEAFVNRYKGGHTAVIEQITTCRTPIFECWMLQEFVRGLQTVTVWLQRGENCGIWLTRGFLVLVISIEEPNVLQWVS
jgi:hypothetical protein